MVIKDDAGQRIMVIEIKYAKDEADILKKQKEALRQFSARRYIDSVRDEYGRLIGYGIVFHKKRCIIDRISF